jgi:hypothetical protein
MDIFCYYSIALADAGEATEAHVFTLEGVALVSVEEAEAEAVAAAEAEAVAAEAVALAAAVFCALGGNGAPALKVARKTIRFRSCLAITAWCSVQVRLSLAGARRFTYSEWRSNSTPL